MHSELVMTNLPEQHEISPFTLSFAHLDTHTHQCVVRIVSLMSWFGCSWVMGMSAWWDLTPVQPGRVYWVHPTPRAAKGPILTDSSACNCWQRWHRFVDGAIMTWPQAVCRKYLCPLLQVELQFEFWFRENKSELKFNSVDACSLRGATTDPKTLISEPIDSHRMAISRRFPKLLTDIPTKDSSVVQSATWCITMTRKTCFGESAIAFRLSGSLHQLLQPKPAQMSLVIATWATNRNQNVSSTKVLAPCHQILRAFNIWVDQQRCWDYIQLTLALDVINVPSKCSTHFNFLACYVNIRSCVIVISSRWHQCTSRVSIWHDGKMISPRKSVEDLHLFAQK